MRVGFTSGYQGKRFGNTSVTDEPYEFVLGAGQVRSGASDRNRHRRRTPQGRARQAAGAGPPASRPAPASLRTDHWRV